MEREATTWRWACSCCWLTTMPSPLFDTVLGQPGEARDYKRYEIYFDGSVFGLSEGQPGALSRRRHWPRRATSASISPRLDDRVLVIVGCRRGTTPVSARYACAPLAPGRHRPAVHRPAAGSSRPTPLACWARASDIPSFPSRKGDIEAFVERLPDLLGDTARLVERVEGLLSDENLQAVSTTLANVEAASRDMPAVTRSAAELAAELRRTAAEVSALTQKVHGIGRHCRTADRGVPRGRAGHRGKNEPHGRQSREDRRGQRGQPRPVRRQRRRGPAGTGGRPARSERRGARACTRPPRPALEPADRAEGVAAWRFRLEAHRTAAGRVRPLHRLRRLGVEVGQRGAGPLSAGCARQRAGGGAGPSLAQAITVARPRSVSSLDTDRIAVDDTRPRLRLPVGRCAGPTRRRRWSSSCSSIR